jgi:hypothetical protein
LFLLHRGHGYLLATIAAAHPHITGSTLDLASVIKDSNEAQKLKVQDRVTVVAGDFFSGQGITPADAYMMKHILHDWSDDEVCLY